MLETDKKILPALSFLRKDSQMKKKILLALLFSMVFVWLLLSRIEVGQFSRIAGRLDITGFITACFIFTLANVIRALRFDKLDHTGRKPVHWWNITAFYNVVTATLPGGAGEAATAYVIKRFSDFDLLAALRILLLSRLMDLFAMALLFFIAALCISSVAPYREAAILISGILLLLSLLALLRSTEEIILKLIRKFPGKGPFKERLYEKLSALKEVSEEQRKNNSFAMTLFLSVVMMTVGSVSIHLLLRSFGIDFNLLQSVYCYGIYMIFQIVPVQGVAGIGTQAAWWALALHAAGYDAPDAVATGFVLHGAFYALILFIGFLSLLFWMKNKTGS